MKKMIKIIKKLFLVLFVITAMFFSILVLVAAAANGIEGMYGLVSNTKFAAVRLDAATHTITTILYAHHEVHAGSSFVVSETTTLNDGATRGYLIETPNTTKWPHIICDIGGSFDTRWQLYEASARTAGTAMTEVNRNRNSATAATVVVTHTPGAGADGTIIFDQRFGNDSGPAGKGGGGGAARGINEFVLKQNTKYYLLVTSYTDANNISVALDWYEHTDKN